MGQRHSVIRALLRLSVLAIHILNGLMLVLINRLRLGDNWFDTRKGRQLIRKWARQACHILAVQIESNGVVSPVKGTLFVANHISWIDIIALYTELDIKFIAKDAVKSWPLIGRLATSTGNLFIERNRHFAMNAVINNIRSELDNNNSIMVFPEGTTTDGWNVKRFYTGLFSSVTNTDTVVQTIALYYKRDGGIDEHAPYIGEDNFITHLFRIASLEKTCLHINFGVPFLPGSMDRHELAALAYSSVVGMLTELRGQTPARLSWAA